jgi:1-deoxy-D-xylulose-5-phosphate reductoisomerase
VQTNFAEIGRLDFEEPDTERFPSLDLARRAGEVGGTLPAVLNAANEIAVQAFCDRQISFTDITTTVSRTMESHQVVAKPTLEDILSADLWARETALAPA